jgi:hypothetical protein
MTINLGQFGGVYWHDENGNEQEVVNKNNTKPVQGMLFHPLTGTGVPGDPMQTTIGRERDVRDAFGFSFPDVEKSGIPREMLGTQETNPKLSTLTNRRSSSGSYDPDTNTINLRPEGHILRTGETAIHELGHSRDRDRVKNLYSKTGYVPEAEGTADAFEDRFSSQNIMRPSGDFDPTINPDRASEIMKDPIEKVGNSWGIFGYGGNSYVWRDKVEQGSYAIARMMGAMRPSGLPARRVQPLGGGLGSAYLLSGVQLTKAQAKQDDLAKPVGNGYVRWSDRADTTAARTIHIGRLYKFNPQVKQLLDDAGLQDLGEFASEVHTAYKSDQTKYKKERIVKAIQDGKTYDEDPTSVRAVAAVEDYEKPNRKKDQVKAFKQPSLFGPEWEIEEANKSAEAAGVIETRISGPESAKEHLKKVKVKKPKKRETSEWDKLKEAHKNGLM